jgi:hypothetical protein
MLKKIIFSFFFLISGTNAFSQASGFDDFSNKLLFNIFKPEPDTSIRDFLRLYIPSLYPGQKNANNTNHSGTASFDSEIHSFIFTRHPFFKSHFSNGKIEFYCRRYHNPVAIELYDVKLWFEFDTQTDADLAFSNLIETYLPISTQHKIGSEAGSQTAAFSNLNAKNTLTKIQFRYIADPLKRNHYSILFETTNTL